MARGFERAPKGIVINNIGYPIRKDNGPKVSGSERQQLLRQYSDISLGQLENRLDRSVSRLKAIKIGGSVLAATAFLAVNYLAFPGAFEMQHSMPLDPVASGIVDSYKGIIGALSHLGMHDSSAQFMTALYGLPIGVPLATAIGVHYAGNVREAQQRTVQNEQERRKIEKAIQAAIEERERQKAFQQLQIILVTS